MRILKIILCKIASFILKLLGRGSNYPGALALKLNIDFKDYFKMPKTVIAVTGSAGKGSTSTMIADALRLDNKTVAHNRYGSNMLPGILTLLINNSKLNGQITSDALVVEVDERNTKSVFEIINPDFVVITNICRDQPPRHGNVDLVFDKIKEALKEGTHLILNGDDPYLRKFNLNNEYKVTYYGINKNNNSYKKQLFDNINMYYCPVCKDKLLYKYYHFESLGDYYCKCGFKRENIKYLANKIDLDNNYMLVNNNKVNISFSVLYYAYNILAAYSVLSLLKIKDEDICKYIGSMENNSKLNNYIKYNNRDIYIMNNKAEDSTTFNESVLFTNNHNGKKIIVVGWKEISRRYEYNDMSWLYDIKFELLNDKDTKLVVCVGRDKYDIATRMKYAGFSKKQIKTFDDITSCKEFILSRKEDIYGILNFDYVNPFIDLFKEEK